MNPESIEIRAARPDDRPAIHALLTAAFGAEEAPRIVQLVDEALEDPSARPLLSLVAVDGTRVLGHILFTRAEVDTGGEPLAASLLAPMAVHPEVQGQGIGGRLIAAGLEALEAMDVGLVFVLGHPGYYPRSGFEPAGRHGLSAPYPIPDEHAAAWMVKVLRSGLLGQVTGRVRCAAALDHGDLWVE
ncbi:N-acetyltransferase [Guyparkeria hydrothermalis]|uniref:GNAT family N-acetyltransferase n=1 Tax=Guyparkeria TaxID=2035712 RepID=UPI001FFC59DC|nr:N-acetyltransferase [Guyparkeria sp. SB14A]MCL7750131.1 N-acetyltransferase [Guyparkeria hydrothermalis]